MKMTASLTSLNVSGMEMMGELNILFDVALVCILLYLKMFVRFLVVSAVSYNKSCKVPLAGVNVFNSLVE